MKDDSQKPLDKVEEWIGYSSNTKQEDIEEIEKLLENHDIVLTMSWGSLAIILVSALYVYLFVDLLQRSRKIRA